MNEYANCKSDCKALRDKVDSLGRDVEKECFSEKRCWQQLEDAVFLGKLVNKETYHETREKRDRETETRDRDRDREETEKTRETERPEKPEKPENRNSDGNRNDEKNNDDDSLAHHMDDALGPV